MKEHDHPLGTVTGLIRQAGTGFCQRYSLGIDLDLDSGAVEVGERGINALSFASRAGASILDLAVVEVVDIFSDPAVVDEMLLALILLSLGEDDPDEPVRIGGRVDRHDFDGFVNRVSGEPHIPLMIEGIVIARQGYGGRGRVGAAAGVREGHASQDQRRADQQPRESMNCHVSVTSSIGPGRLQERWAGLRLSTCGSRGR